MKFFEIGFGKPMRQQRANERESTCHDRSGHRHFRGAWRNGFGKRNGQPRRGRSDDSSADVRGETFARAAKVQRENERDVISPKTKLRDGE